MSSNNVILITGLMRRPDVLRRSMAIYIRLRAAGLIDKVVIATWRSEVDKFREVVLPLLAGQPADGVVLVVGEDPNITISPAYNGTFMHQSILRERGMEMVPRHAWVLKTRSDCFIPEGFLQLLLGRMRDHVLDQPPPGPLTTLKAKVWVPWMHISAPFYLEDMCYFGRKADLALMHNYDISSILHTPRTVNVHQTLYYRPFRDRFDIFYEAFRLAHRLQVHYDSERQPCSEALASELLELALASSAFMKLLVLYWKLIFANFFIYSEGEFGSEFATYPGGGEVVNAPYTQASVFSQQPRDVFDLMRGQKLQLFAYNNSFTCRNSAALKQLFEMSALASSGAQLMAHSQALDHGEFEADEAWLAELAALFTAVRNRRVSELQAAAAAS